MGRRAHGAEETMADEKLKALIQEVKDAQKAEGQAPQSSPWQRRAVLLAGAAEELLAEKEKRGDKDKK